MTIKNAAPGGKQGAAGNGLESQGQRSAPLSSVNGRVPELDPDAVQGTLALYRGAAGLISVVSAPNNWSGREFPTSLAGLEQAVQYVRDLDAQGAEGIYLRGTTVRAIATGRGGADDSVAWLRVQLDLDHGKTGYAPDAATVRKLVDATGLSEPSRWINSGHGLYPQWWLDKPCEDSPAVRALAQDIEAVVAAEFTRHGYKIDSTSDAARPWRIPGTVNRKREPFVPCRVLETSGRAYSFAELRAAVPSSTRTKTNGSGLKQAQRNPFTRSQAEAFIAESAGRFTGSTEGGQNNVANVLSFVMGHFVTTDDHPGHWTRQEAEGWAWEAGEQCGYAQRDPSGLRATIQSGLDAGMRDPFPCDLDEPAESAEHEQMSSWALVDLVPLLAGDYEPPRAEILRRSDGVALLYPGKLHSLHGESESGKSWVVLIASAEVLADGGHVLFVDHESDAVTVVERLVALGVTRAVIPDRFHYLRPDEPVNGAVFGEVLARPYRLAVVDGVTEGISVEGLSSNDADQVAEWIRKVPRRIAMATGAATVVVDHVTKTRDGRGRFALGSQHKMNALTGAAYTVDVVIPFGRGQVGQLVLRVGKDRPGAVRPHAGPPSSVDRTAEVARVRIDARDPKSIAVRLEGWSPPGPEPTAERDAFTAPEWWHFDLANVPGDATAIRGPGYRAVSLVYARTFALGEVGGTPAGIVSDVVRHAKERRLANHSRSSCKDAMAALQSRGVIVKTGEGGHVAVADEYRETGR